MIPAKPGVTYEPGRGRDRASSQLVAREPASASARSTLLGRRSPTFTTKDARALKIKEQVSTFTTYYPYAEYRNVNIGRAAELVNGTVLKPGEIFSLNDIVGERTRENGFTEGFIISNGIFKEDLGGGVSQMATTTFNAMFFAGLKDVEHKPHSFYIDRYPVGREATVAWGAVDLRFENDTPYGVLVEARVTPAHLLVAGRGDGVDVVDEVLGHHQQDRRALQPHQARDPHARPPRTATPTPATAASTSTWALLPQARLRQPVRTEKFFTRYIPSDTVICK